MRRYSRSLLVAFVLVTGICVVFVSFANTSYAMTASAGGVCSWVGCGGGQDECMSIYIPIVTEKGVVAIFYAICYKNPAR